MTNQKKVKTALISVFNKTGLTEIVEKLAKLNIEIISTGGTKNFIEKLGISVTAVEDLTHYPAILGGRVKTLHPRIFGGILARRELEQHQAELKTHQINEIDLLIVDLYPFEETLAETTDNQEIIEKIDIGGISLIRAAAKNHNDVLVVSSRKQYQELNKLLTNKTLETDLQTRKKFAAEAFQISSHYDTAIFNYLTENNSPDVFKYSMADKKTLRYGENPHQEGSFFGKWKELFEQVHGKEISYNNLLDIDAAIHLIAEFSETTFAILKHNNACGLASRQVLKEAWQATLAGDPLSAFGGVLICNRSLDTETAAEINKLFFEVIIAPAYSAEALSVLKQKKNRIILIQKTSQLPDNQFKSLLNGVIVQQKDMQIEGSEDLKQATKRQATASEIEDLIFANKIVKHSKSNAIVLAKNKQLCGSGVGQTSRVDALQHAISKAHAFKLDLQGAAMASDAFFPFADSVEIAHNQGVTSVIQPGGSIRDKDSIAYCDKNGIAMVFTGIRHFKH